MSIVYRIHKDKGISLVVWNGLIKADDFLAHVRQLSSDADWPTAKRLHLSDLRYTSLDASMDDAIIAKAANLYGEHPTKIERLKVAIVAGDAFNKAIVFERVISKYGATATVFNSLDTACTWLGLDIYEIEAALQQLQTRARDGKNQQGDKGSATAQG